MNVFDVAVLRLMGFPVRTVSPGLALLGLGVAIEAGREKMAEASGITLPEFALMLREAVMSAPERLLFEDFGFNLSLRIGIIRTMAVTPKEESWREAFRKRLTEIFVGAPELAQRLADHALEKMDDDFRSGGVEKAAPTQDVLRAHYSMRRRLAEQPGPTLGPTTVAVRRRGTNSWLEPCPECDTKKRCFKNMKRFRCECGFDKPYPFSAST